MAQRRSFRTGFGLPSSLAFRNPRLAARIARDGRAQHLHSFFFLLRSVAGQNLVPDFSFSVTASRPGGYQISHVRNLKIGTLGWSRHSCLPVLRTVQYALRKTPSLTSAFPQLPPVQSDIKCLTVRYLNCPSQSAFRSAVLSRHPCPSEQSVVSPRRIWRVPHSAFCISHWYFVHIRPRSYHRPRAAPNPR